MFERMLIILTAGLNIKTFMCADKKWSHKAKVTQCRAACSCAVYAVIAGDGEKCLLLIIYNIH